jgi:hypothetical protein
MNAFRGIGTEYMVSSDELKNLKQVQCSIE